VRVGVYAALLVAFGSWLSFSRLGEGMLLYDEASFAYTTDTMLRTGEYVTLKIDERNYHTNAAPLYNWLTCLTYDWGWPGEMRYRVWSGVFGVLCGIATLALGTMLFSPEVGVLAALILLLNRNFLLLHGIRYGGMEPGTLFFITSMLACYARTHRAGVRERLWWCLAGACLGGAVLMKPPAFAGFMFVMMCVHNFVVRRDLGVWKRVLGPALALAVAGAVAGPWYAALTVKLGPIAPTSLFISNSIKRSAARGGAPQRPVTFYLDVIRGSSGVFGLLVPLAAAALVAVVARVPGRFGFGLLLWLSGTFLVTISLSATKHTHYAYYAFSLLSVLAAAVLLAGLGEPPRPGTWFRHVWRLVGCTGVVAAVVVLRGAPQDLAELRGERYGYPPLVFHDAMGDPLAAGRVRLMAVGYPDGSTNRDRTRGFTENDSYYHQFRLPHCVRPEQTEVVNAALADGIPTVVFLEPVRRHTDPVTLGLSCPPDRYALLKSGGFFYPVLTFHGVERVCDLEAVFRKHTLIGAPAPTSTAAAP
jgi:4-amino-4-deoxy-L-arabinose transferase-like glycosyltransferase